MGSTSTIDEWACLLYAEPLELARDPKQMEIVKKRDCFEPPPYRAARSAPLSSAPRREEQDPLYWKSVYHIGVNAPSIHHDQRHSGFGAFSEQRDRGLLIRGP